MVFNYSRSWALRKQRKHLIYWLGCEGVSYYQKCQALSLPWSHHLAPQPTKQPPTVHFHFPVTICQSSSQSVRQSVSQAVYDESRVSFGICLICPLYLFIHPVQIVCAAGGGAAAAVTASSSSSSSYASSSSSSSSAIVSVSIARLPNQFASKSNRDPSKWRRSHLWCHLHRPHSGPIWISPYRPFPFSHSTVPILLRSKYACVCAFERYILRRKFAGLHIANILRGPSPLLSLSLSLSPCTFLPVSMISAHRARPLGIFAFQIHFISSQTLRLPRSKAKASCRPCAARATFFKLSISNFRLWRLDQHEYLMLVLDKLRRKCNIY